MLNDADDANNADDNNKAKLVTEIY